MPTQYEMTLREPAFLAITSPDRGIRSVVDVYEAHRMLCAAEKQPSEQLRWTAVKEWLQDDIRLGPDTELAENNAREFHEAVCQIVRELQDELKKKLGLIACSRQPTQESQTTTQPGILT